jgi:hypothetical protein
MTNFHGTPEQPHEGLPQSNDVPVEAERYTQEDSPFIDNLQTRFGTFVRKLCALHDLRAKHEELQSKSPDWVPDHIMEEMDRVARNKEEVLAQPKRRQEKRESDCELATFVHRTILSLAQELQLPLSPQDLPSVRFHDRQRGISHYDPTSNILVIGRQCLITSPGETLGEEIGHFLRHHSLIRNISRPLRPLVRYARLLRPQTLKGKLTNEFFGYLGRRLLFRASQNVRGYGTLLFPKGAPRFALHRIDYPQRRKEYQRSPLPSKEKRRMLAQLEVDREHDLTHDRGYHFAAAVDLDRIHDWDRLFTLPGQGVRRRFFTDTPDYDGL